MLPTTLLLFLGSTQAGEIFTSVSEPYLTPFEGHPWIRSLPAEEGWWFFHAIEGDFSLAKIDDDYNFTQVDFHGLTGRSDLVDHGITSCPDGGALHAAFSRGAGEIQHVFRYDADWNLLHAETTYEDDPDIHSSDPPVLCSNLLNAVGSAYGHTTSFRLAILDDNGSKVDQVDLPGDQSSAGASMMVDGDEESLIVVTNPWYPPEGPPHVSLYSLADFSLLHDQALDIPTGPNRRAFWPQGLIRVGNHRIVAYLVTMEVHGTHQDTGDVWLSAFDLDWNHVETVEVAVEPSDWWAYSRPFVTRKGNVLLVTYDHANGNQMSVVTVDLGALGVESGDTGLPDPDSGDDTGDSSGPGGAADCGCSGIAHSGSSGWLLGLLGALVGRRRQSSPA